MSQDSAVSMEKKKLDSKDIKNIKTFCLIFSIANILCIILMSVFWSPSEWPIILGLGILGSAPAYIANAGMTFAGTIHGIGRSMDFGKNFIDGKRILGEGKTWKGFLGGILVGCTFSWILVLVYSPIATAAINVNPAEWDNLGQITLNEVLFFVQPTPFNLAFRTILLAVGAPIGDCVGSFFKRRFNKPRGTQFFVVDQIDFLLMAYLFAYAFFPLSWYYILVISLFTPLIVILSNVVAYHIGRKSVPW